MHAGNRSHQAEEMDLWRSFQCDCISCSNMKPVRRCDISSVMHGELPFHKIVPLSTRTMLGCEEIHQRVERKAVALMKTGECILWYIPSGQSQAPEKSTLFLTVSHFPLLGMKGASALKNVFLDKLRRLNIYTECHSDSLRVRRDQILSTRVYFLLLLLSVVSLSGYIALSWQLLNFEINDPTFATYVQLQAKYPETLTCPCMRIAVDVGTFASIAVSFHQVRYSNRKWDSQRLGNGHRSCYEFLSKGHFDKRSGSCFLEGREATMNLDDFAEHLQSTTVFLGLFQPFCFAWMDFSFVWS